MSNSSESEASVILESVTTIGVQVLLILMSVVGNVMVIISVFTYRPLRHVQNFLLVSLACADLGVSVLVLPFHILLFIYKEWSFPFFLCDIFVTSDILFCTASILNICAIAIDRYWAIKWPLSYARKRNLTTVLIMIAMVYGLSCIISIAPIFGWRTPRNSTTECSLPKRKDYVIFSAFGSFYIPATIMITVYINIFIALRRRLQQRGKSSAAYKLKQISNVHNNEASTHKTLTNCKSTDPPSTCSNEAEENGSISAPLKDADSPENQQNEENRKIFAKAAKDRKKLSLCKERRAARTLGMIMGIFILCWLPFFIMYLGSPFGLVVAPRVEMIIVWLGYVNSGLNPIIYTIFNVDFRKAFAILLRLDSARCRCVGN